MPLDINLHCVCPFMVTLSVEKTEKCLRKSSVEKTSHFTHSVALGRRCSVMKTGENQI